MAFEFFKPKRPFKILQRRYLFPSFEKKSMITIEYESGRKRFMQVTSRQLEKLKKLERELSSD